MTGNNNYEKTTRTRPRFGLEEFTERTKRDKRNKKVRHVQRMATT